MSLCNICEAPATMHIGAGPRCDRHQYHEGRSLGQLREARAQIDHEIADRFAEKMHALEAARSRDSVPPGLSTNAPTRAASDKHFQNARKILGGIK